MSRIAKEGSARNLARSAPAFALSSSEPGVKHAHKPNMLRFLNGRACLTPGSEEDK